MPGNPTGRWGRRQAGEFSEYPLPWPNGTAWSQHHVHALRRPGRTDTSPRERAGQPGAAWLAGGFVSGRFRPASFRSCWGRAPGAPLHLAGRTGGALPGQGGFHAPGKERFGVSALVCWRSASPVLGITPRHPGPGRDTLRVLVPGLMGPTHVRAPVSSSFRLVRRGG